MPTDLQTVRIPELDYGLTYVASLDPEDRVPLWLSNEDKTVNVRLADLAGILGSGGGGGGGTGGTPLGTVYMDGKLIVTIAAADDGGDTLNIPAIAGYDFYLALEGRDLIKRDPNDPQTTDEYEVLAGGGFRLLNGLKLYGADDPATGKPAGSRYTIDLYTLQQQNNNNASGSLFSGDLIIAGNRNLLQNDLGKLYQLRGSNSSLTVTLPSLSVVPDNQILVFETSITNTKPHAIQTTGGQFIYVNKTGLTQLYLHPGEVLWLKKSADGYFCISDYGKYYALVGKFLEGLTVEDDEVLLNGQELNRADYPRLWQKAQASGASLVGDATWQTAAVYRQGNNYYTVPPAGTYETIERPYRGCFSTGNGSTTFRVPDLMNAFTRAIKSTVGTDTERYQNQPGIYQNELVGPVTVTGNVIARASGASGSGSLVDGTNDGQNTNVQITLTGGGLETRPGNIGVLKVTKF